MLARGVMSQILPGSERGNNDKIQREYVKYKIVHHNTVFAGCALM